MDLPSGLRQRRAIERCPYCHDLIDDGDLARVECPACHTQHHVVCIQELGRCTVHGCEQPLAPVESERRLEDSPALRRIRKRLRQRVRQFVRSNAKNRRDQFLAVMERAREHEDAGRLQATAAAYLQVASFDYSNRSPEVQSDSELQAVVGTLSPLQARRKSRALLGEHQAVVLRRAKILSVLGQVLFLLVPILLALLLGD